jgi:hypothetical protein
MGRRRGTDPPPAQPDHPPPDPGGSHGCQPAGDANGRAGPPDPGPGLRLLESGKLFESEVGSGAGSGDGGQLTLEGYAAGSSAEAPALEDEADAVRPPEPERPTPPTPPAVRSGGPGRGGRTGMARSSSERSILACAARWSSSTARDGWSSTRATRSMRSARRTSGTSWRPPARGLRHHPRGHRAGVRAAGQRADDRLARVGQAPATQAVPHSA